MQARLQQVELGLAVLVADHELAVGDVAALRELDLREVARQRLAAARLDVGVGAVDEDDRSEAVELLLVGPLVSLRQLLAGQRELRLDRWAQWQFHASTLIQSLLRLPGS